MLLKKLVVAEDDDAVAHLVGAGLGDAGFLCLRANNGEDAIRLVRNELPDALVLDVMLPKMNGIDVCRKIKADPVLSRTPIVLVTAKDSVDDRVTGLDAGADDYLVKPFDLRELAARVKAVIRQSTRERDRNPLTNLPGSESLSTQVSERLRGQEEFGVLYLDAEHFGSFSELYGHGRADATIRAFGTAILKVIQQFAEPQAPFVCHLGGDDFIAVCTTQQIGPLAQALEDACRGLVAAQYDEADRIRGYALPKNSDEETATPIPLMRPSVARLEVKPGQFKSAEELASELTRLKVSERSSATSGFYASPRGLK